MDSFRVYRNVLLQSEVDAIVEACKIEEGWKEAEITEPSHFYLTRKIKAARSCKLKILPEPINEPIRCRLNDLVQSVWTEFSFDGRDSDVFKLQGEAFLVMKYRPADHFTWHTDCPKDETTVTNFIAKRRRVSATIVVKDCESGGELQFRNPKEETIGLSSRDCVLFSSQISHRVKPVEQGERISLVGWYELVNSKA